VATAADIKRPELSLSTYLHPFSRFKNICRHVITSPSSWRDALKSTQILPLLTAVVFRSQSSGLWRHLQ